MPIILTILVVYICKQPTLLYYFCAVFELFPMIDPIKSVAFQDFPYIMLNKKRADSVYNPLPALNTANCIFVNNLLSR